MARTAAAAALHAARRQARVAAVVIVDIDRFKSVNDTFGHMAGDAVLTSTAAAVVQCVRRTDMVGRFGGDEFCALVVCDTSEEVMVVAERIRNQIGEVRLTDPARRVTASIGVAAVDTEAAYDDLAGLIAAADQALYQAKASGRDRVCLGASLGGAATAGLRLLSSEDPARST